MRSDKVIYKLVVADIQDVAEQELDRKLTEIEINGIINLIADNIDWYDAIERAIDERIDEWIEN